MRTNRFIIAFGFLAVVMTSYGFASETQNQILFKGGIIDTAVEPQIAIPVQSAIPNAKSVVPSPDSVIPSPKARVPKPLVAKPRAAKGEGSQKIYLIIQFREKIHENMKEEIRKLGGEFMTYIPNRAFVIRIEERFVTALSSLKTIQWVGNYAERFKVDPLLLQNKAAPDVPVNEEEIVTLNVKLFRGEDGKLTKRFFEEILRSATSGSAQDDIGRILYEGRNLFRVSVPRRLIPEIAKRSEVEWIEEAKTPQLLNYVLSESMVVPESIVIPESMVIPAKAGIHFGKEDYEDLTGFESGVKILNPEAVYEAGLRGNGQIVAVADTGIDVGAMDQTLSLDFQNRLFKGYALGFWRESFSDEHGHGTHVSGSILGSGDYSSGLLAGVANESQLVMQSLMGALRTMDIPSDLSDLFSPVYEDGARIHSNSWGHPAFGYEETASSVDKYMWDHPDFLVVVAAGNSGADLDKDGVIDSGSLLSPATAKNCLTVGASENYVLTGGVQKPWGKFRGGDKAWGAEPIASDMPSDNPNGIAAFSSRGPTPDGRLKPDVVTPGTNILSARTHVPESDKLWGEYNEHYLWSGGTSMAAPLASGAAALVRQFYIDHYRLPFVSAALVKATLVNGADDLYPGQFGFGKVLEIPSKRPNIHEGWGRVNLEQTLIFKNRALHFFDETVGLATKKEKTYSVRVVDPSQPLKVTLAYTDYPGAASAAKALVNDLDLIVTAPNQAIVHFPNGLRSPDRLNTVEGIDIASPKAGDYGITVRGHHVPNGKNGAQPYALVVTGGIE